MGKKAKGNKGATAFERLAASGMSLSQAAQSARRIAAAERDRDPSGLLERMARELRSAPSKDRARRALFGKAAWCGRHGLPRAQCRAHLVEAAVEAGVSPDTADETYSAGWNRGTEEYAR